MLQQCECSLITHSRTVPLGEEADTRCHVPQTLRSDRRRGAGAGGWCSTPPPPRRLRLQVRGCEQDVNLWIADRGCGSGDGVWVAAWREEGRWCMCVCQGVMLG